MFARAQAPQKRIQQIMNKSFTNQKSRLNCSQSRRALNVVFLLFPKLFEYFIRYAILFCSPVAVTYESLKSVERITDLNITSITTSIGHNTSDNSIVHHHSGGSDANTSHNNHLSSNNNNNNNIAIKSEESTTNLSMNDREAAR